MIIHQMTPLLNPGLPGWLGEGIQLLASSSPGYPMMAWTGIRHGADSQIGSLNFLNSSGHNTSHELPGIHGFFVQTETPGVYISGLTDELFVVDCRGIGLSQPLPKCTATGLKISDRPDHLINDGICTSRGILFGTKAAKWLDFTGELNFVPFEGQPRVIHGTEKRQCSNGVVVLRVEGELLICAYIDSPAQKVEMMSINFVTGEYRRIRTIFDFTNNTAFPDGMRAAPGFGEITHLVVAFFNPGMPDHGMLREVEIATGQVTAEWQHSGAGRVTCLDFRPTSGETLEMVSTTADEGTPQEAQAANPFRGWLFSGPTHYPTAHLRKPALVPDAFWQKFVAA